MSIEDEGLPLHEGATAKIRPRIFLEGNFFVDLKPGAPGTEELDDGATIPVTQTATPVQLDQVLTALQADTREDLRDVLEGFGAALRSKPSAADDATPTRPRAARRRRSRGTTPTTTPARRARAQSQVNRRCSAPSPSRTSAG